MNVSKIQEGIRKDIDLDKIYEEKLNEQIPEQEGNIPPSDKLPTEGVENIPPETSLPSEEVPSDNKVDPIEPEEVKQEKEFFGGKGKDTFFYLVRVPDESGKGISDLQIVDTEGMVHFSAKGSNIDINDEKTFAKEAINKVELDVIGVEIVNRYDLLGMQAEAGEEEKEKLEAAGLGTKEPEQSISEEPKSITREEGVF